MFAAHLRYDFKEVSTWQDRHANQDFLAAIWLKDVSGMSYEFLYTSNDPYIQLDMSWFALFSGGLLKPKTFYIPARTLYAECPYRWHANLDSVDGVQRLGQMYASLYLASENEASPQNRLALRDFGGREHLKTNSSRWCVPQTLLRCPS